MATIVETGTYYDGDGLLRKYGTYKAIANPAGEYKTYGPLRTVECKVTLANLTTTVGQTVMSDQVFFPKLRIESVDLEVETAATSSGSATFDIGLIQTDRTTEIDYNGFIAAEVLSGVLDTVGKKIIYTAGVSKAGALIGTTTTNVGYIVANANTAVFTAGVVYVRINYRVD